MARTRIKPSAINTTAGSVLSTWTTATRPASPTAGQFGYNSTLGYLEWYSPTSNWTPMYSSPSYLITYAMLGGGGGATGGTSGVNYGSGGAAGVYRTATVTVIPGNIYTITIGAGGTGVQAGTPSAASASTISGAGVSASASAGNAATQSSTGASNADYSGASSGGTGQYPGFGGAGAGGNASGLNGGTGVDVTTTILAGSTTTLGGGGGGGSSTTAGTGGAGGGGNGSPTGNGGNGTANTGSGGGGSNASYIGGSGGSGVVYLVLLTSRYTGTTSGSPTISTSGNYTILKYTSSGSYTA